MTVTALARAAGFSRGAVLYYERAAGLTLADIRAVLDRPSDDFAAILNRRMAGIGEAIERLRGQQRAIARMLQQTGKSRRKEMLSKEKWTKVRGFRTRICIVGANSSKKRRPRITKSSSAF